MRNIRLIVLLFSILLTATDLSAQDKIDKLADKIDKIADKMAEQQTETNKHMAELAKQLAVTATKVENLEKTMDKRFDDANKRVDILLFVMLGIMGGTFGLIGFVVWDRQASVKPILEQNITLKKEIEQLAQRELRHEEAVAKNFKKILDKFPDLVGLT
jgi:predicted transcriptional regulator